MPFVCSALPFTKIFCDNNLHDICVATYHYVTFNSVFSHKNKCVTQTVNGICVQRDLSD